MPIYQTSFEVNTSADRVWNVLAGLDRYAERNPQIPESSGVPEVESQIKLRLPLPGRPSMDLSAIVEEVRPTLLLTWCVHVMAAWFFEGYRRFEISPVAETGVRVTHIEDVRGLFATVFSAIMGTPVRKSQVSLNDALRCRAESGT